VPSKTPGKYGILCAGAGSSFNIQS
jgi:hypothetical protein